jgi:flavin-dependent dehydrogenase
MLCADIAADTLHKGLTSGCLSASCLEEYQLEWQRLLKKELRAEYLARRLYQHISDSRIDKIFALAKAEGWVDEVMAKKQIAFDWHGQALFGVMKTRSLAMVSEKITRLWSFKNKDAVPPRQK